MRRTILALLLLAAAPAAAQTTTCTPQCVQSYEQRGLPTWEARRVCGCTAGTGGTATTCVTAVGTCRMAAPAPAGSYCVCATPRGPVPGRAQ
ncbi:hypothetical protein [Stella sp.]|uniref:hypothetical protein n=1 Tax=Stella sp. TaxID=2912054 RepID=UPI0035ADAC5E